LHHLRATERAAIEAHDRNLMIRAYGCAGTLCSMTGLPPGRDESAKEKSMAPNVLLRAMTIVMFVMLLSWPAVGHAQSRLARVLPANSGGCLTPTTPQFNSATQPGAVQHAPQEMPVSPVDPVPGSSAVGGTTDPNSGLSTGCTGQVYSASRC
jgi:hypothetical protein